MRYLIAPFIFKNGILYCYPKPLFYVSIWHLEIGQVSPLKNTSPPQL